MPVVGGVDIHRKQLTFDYLDTVTGQVRRGQVAPAGRGHLRAWLARFAGRGDVAFAMEGCAGWRYVAGELAVAGIGVHLAGPADTAAARGRKRRAKTDRTDARHLRQLLAEGRLPECWIPPARILECRALLETYHDLRRESPCDRVPVHAVVTRQVRHARQVRPRLPLPTDDACSRIRVDATVSRCSWRHWRSPACCRTRWCAGEPGRPRTGSRAGSPTISRPAASMSLTWRGSPSGGGPVLRARRDGRHPQDIRKPAASPTLRTS
jgi:hypothetical protein